MERYILFGGDQYYPSGGVGDMQGAYSTVDEAVEDSGGEDGYDWWHVFDVETRKVVADGRKGWVLGRQCEE